MLSFSSLGPENTPDSWRASLVALSCCGCRNWVSVVDLVQTNVPRHYPIVEKPVWTSCTVDLDHVGIMSVDVYIHLFNVIPLRTVVFAQVDKRLGVD